MNNNLQSIKCHVFILCLAAGFFILPENESYSQSWKKYPCIKPGSKIEFPRDEGFHPVESLEWWYASGHFTGQKTGDQYSFMLTYFHKPVSVFGGFRILKITNETTHKSFSQVLPCIYQILSTDSLHILATFITGDPSEEWVNQVDSNGTMLPFQYLIHASTGNASVSLNLDAKRSPLIVDEDGLLCQGSGSYTYYYSLTNLATNGSIVFNGMEETVTGICWFDRQYGNFDPYEDESYEWFSIQLDGNMDLNIWNIFTPDNSIPQSKEYRICSVIINDTVSFTTRNFQIERLSYAFTPDSQKCYATSWRIISDTLGMDLLVKVNDENSEINISEIALRFYEGSTKIKGKINDEIVTGVGFAELLHSYEIPILQFRQPAAMDQWSYQIPLIWYVSNQDDGNPLKFDIEIESQSMIFAKAEGGMNDTLFYWNPSVFRHDSTVNVRITGYSTDTTLSDIVIRTFLLEPENTDLLACTGENISIDLNLDNENLFFKWFYNGQLSGFPETSTLEINPVTFESEGVYKCLIYNEFFEDTTLEYHLRVELCDQIEQNQTGNLIIFPNPFDDYLAVHVPLKSEKYVLRMINLQGSLIYESVLTGMFEEIILPCATPGIYIIEIVNGKQNLLWSSVLIKK